MNLFRLVVFPAQSAVVANSYKNLGHKNYETVPLAMMGLIIIDAKIAEGQVRNYIFKLRISELARFIGKEMDILNIYGTKSGNNSHRKEILNTKNL